MFLGVSHILRSGAQHLRKIWGPLTSSHTVLVTTTKFYMVIKSDVRKIITQLTTNADARSVVAGLVKHSECCSSPQVFVSPKPTCLRFVQVYAY